MSSSSSSSSSSSQPQKQQEFIQRRLARRIISSQKPTTTTTTTTTTTNSKASSQQHPLLLTTIAVAGGGSSAISTLASLPGASRILHDGHVLYSRDGIRHFVNDALGNDDDDDDDLKYVSSEMASLLSLSSLRQALASRRLLTTDNNTILFGIGCTSALRSSDEREGRRHPVHLRVTKTIWEEEEEWGYDAILNPNDEREVQEESVGYLILKLMEECYCGDGGDYDGLRRLKEEEERRRFVSCQRVDRRRRRLGDDGRRRIVEKAVVNVLNGDAETVVLLQRTTPTTTTTTRDDDDDDDDEWGVMNPTYLPSGVVIIPGSFNPIHDGHVRLAEAALARVVVANNSNSGGGNGVMVLFELSLVNADKPPLEKEEVLRRVDLIREMVVNKEKLPMNYSQSSNDGTPTINWGVLLTSKPLFVQKVNMLEQFVLGGAGAKRMNFVIGTDTMIRILDPKYYNDSYDEMINAVKDIKNRGVHFIVGGRLQQIKDHGGGRKFINGEDELKSLPYDLQRMFTLLSEDDFRVDISSTELRKKNENKVKTTS